ncbi:acetate uptake transporter [Actinomadura sp. DC4]|uniref:acetate uptake transporter n=1 Tax=Actinomadura sp. DC4 TaxID=3055069 RepID=UPI0025AF5520|nr:acetate uptake transporter [Actinomadura sp. DC4]MDN3353197.1 acetate uptake transporter [Actinomadura sp. DC4]
MTETPQPPAPAISAIADPAPLGLAAFALTTFLLSAKNADWTNGTDAWLGYAFFYGGLCQLLAGMWEFRNRNTFGATAFSTYGGFWIGLAWYVTHVAPTAGAAAKAAGGGDPELLIQNDLGWILLAFAIFNTYMLLMASQVNTAVFGVFLTLEVTEIVLFIGNFNHSAGTVKLGGWIGVLTAVVAWYTSAAGVANNTPGRISLPVGSPFGAKTAQPVA